MSLQILGIVTVLAVLTFNGWIIFRLLFKTPNKLINIGGAMGIGLLSFLFIVSLTSYLLKGAVAIRLVFGLFFIICFLLYKYHRINLLPRNLQLKNLQSLVIFLILLAYIVLFFRLSPISGRGPEFYIFNGIASSFVKGNYPTVLPWQPDFLSVYHHGAYVLTGAIQSIFSVNLNMLNIILGSYFISITFIFLIGMAREYTRSLLSFLPAIMCIILFGGPVLLTGGYSSFFRDISTPFSLTELFYRLSLQPSFYDFYHPQGGGASGILNLAATPAVALGLIALNLFVFFLINRKWITPQELAYPLLTILAALTLSIEETLFLLEAPLLAFFFVFDNCREIRKAAIKVFVLSLFFLFLFFLVQNPVRDSLITPSPEAPRFLAFLPYDSLLGNLSNRHTNLFNNFKDQFTQRTEALSGRYHKDKGIWTLTNWYYVIVAVFLLAFLTRSSLSLIFAFSASISFFAGVVITNTFWPDNFARFFSQAYLFTMASLGFLVVQLYTQSKRLIYRTTFIVIVALMLPQIVTSHSKWIVYAFSTPQPNLLDLNPVDGTLQKISSLVPSNERVLFIDGYPFSTVFSYVNMRAATIYGMLVPMAPPKPKILTPDDQGIEYYDAVSSLDANSLQALKVDYVFVFNFSLEYLPNKTKTDLARTDYFQPAYSDGRGVLYKATPQFLQLPNPGPTLKSLARSIPDGKVVFIDKFYTNNIPKGLILELAKRTKLIGVNHGVGSGNFMYIETFLPYQITCIFCDTYPLEKDIKKYVSDLDYIFADPKVDPKNIFSGIYAKVGEVPNVILWQKTSIPKTD